MGDEVLEAWDFGQPARREDADGGLINKTWWVRGEEGQPLRETQWCVVRLRGLAGRLGDHARAARELRRWIDQDEASRASAVPVSIEHEGPGGGDLHDANLIQDEPVVDLSRHRARAVLQDVDAAGVQGPFVHPDQLRLERLPDQGVTVAGTLPPVCLLRRTQHVTAADVDLVVQGERHGHGCEGEREVAVVGHDSFHAGAATGGPGGHAIAGLDRP